MFMEFCKNCEKTTGHKRQLGWGTFFAVMLTAGLWLLAIPLYPSRCILCGSDARESKQHSSLVAVMLSGLFPGLGQLYNGERRKAVLFFIAGALTAFGLNPLGVDIDPGDLAAGMQKVLLASLPFLLVAGWSVIDAYRVARRSAAI